MRMKILSVTVYRVHVARNAETVLLWDRVE